MRFLDLVLFGVAAFTIACVSAQKINDTGAQLLSEYGPDIVKLTPVGNPRTGGTGFYMQTPSGQTVTVTNGHVCDLASGGKWLEARDDQGSRELLEIKEISETADLCILSGPKRLDAQPLKLSQFQRREERMWVIGHPFLKPNTITSGFVVTFDEIKLNDSELTPEQCKPPTRAIEDEECVRTLWAYETSIEIFPGNSGSPVLSRNGEVLGVMFAGDGRTNRGVFMGLDDLRELAARY